MDGSVFKYTFLYNNNSGSLPTYFFVPSADCSGGVCEHVFNIPTSNVPLSYTVTAFATNVVGGGPRTTSQPIRESKVECILVALVRESHLIEMGSIMLMMKNDVIWSGH